ncbi:Uncharacterised protein [Halioglobus japonicus]|nr:Uncharacterised protein [Halioglobus japonicus]
MWEKVARSAADDVGVQRDIIGSIDHLGLVHCQSWAYDEPVRRLADRLATDGIYFSESILAGTSPQRLLDEAAERMLRGECSVALVVGGEALATRSAMQRGGETPNWSNPHPSPPALPIDFDEWYLPTEKAHGVLPAWLTFAMLEQARWAARGATCEDRNDLSSSQAMTVATQTACAMASMSVSDIDVFDLYSFYARSDRPATISAVTDGCWATAEAAVTSGENGQNDFEL